MAATAALIEQRFPGSSPAQVARRLLATADPAPGGARSDEYGYGLLNPYRALTETLGPDRPPAPPAAVAHTQDPVVVALQARRAHAQQVALVGPAWESCWSRWWPCWRWWSGAAAGGVGVPYLSTSLLGSRPVRLPWTIDQESGARW